LLVAPLGARNRVAQAIAADSVWYPSPVSLGRPGSEPNTERSARKFGSVLPTGTAGVGVHRRTPSREDNPGRFQPGPYLSGSATNGPWEWVRTHRGEAGAAYAASAAYPDPTRHRKESRADDSAAGSPGADGKKGEVEVAGPAGFAAAQGRMHTSPLGSKSPPISPGSVTTSRSTPSCWCAAAV
jgi:hypothetical protein